MGAFVLFIALFGLSKFPCAAIRNKTRGGLAQLVEHLPCKQGVSGSIPLTSTTTAF